MDGYMPELTGLDRSFAAAARRFELNVSAIRDFVESLEGAATLPRTGGFARFTEQITDLLRKWTRAHDRHAKKRHRMWQLKGCGRWRTICASSFCTGRNATDSILSIYLVEDNVAFRRDASRKDNCDIEVLVLEPAEMESGLQVPTGKFAQGVKPCMTSIRFSSDCSRYDV